MSLEVRQMVVKSSVVQREASGLDKRELERRQERLRRQILDEVRERVRAALDDPKER